MSSVVSGSGGLPAEVDDSDAGEGEPPSAPRSSRGQAGGIALRGAGGEGRGVGVVSRRGVGGREGCVIRSGDFGPETKPLATI